MSAPVLSRLFHVLGKSRSSSLATPRQVRPLDRGPALSPAKLLPETPRPNPQSQSFSRSYGSILPTSLIYIVLSTRGYSPWRPDAVMSTTGGANKSLHQIFKGPPERTERNEGYSAMPDVEPYLRANRFHGDRRLKRKENSSRGSGGRLWFRLRCRTISTSRFRNINLIPFR